MAAVGDAIADVLAAAGVRRFYAVPGESFLEVLDGVERHPDIRLVSTRHESGAAFMGDADAKMTGVPAVVAGTRGVGAANLSIGVHTAFQDSTPMVAILGQVDTAFLGREGFQEVDLPAFYAPITKWGVTAHRTDRIPELIAEALRVARTGRPGPVVVALPADLLTGEIADESVDDARRRLAMRMVGPVADAAACGDVAALLAGAERPVIVAGGGARDARERLVAVAEAYRVGVYAAFRRQDVFPNEHELYLGHLGLGGGDAVYTALRDADLVLVVGSRLSEITTNGYTLPSRSSQVVQIDVDASVVGAIVPTACGIVSDAGAALDLLLEQAPSQTVRARDWSAARNAYLDSQRVPPSRSADGIDNARAIQILWESFPADTVLANDAGNFSAFLHRHWLYRTARSQVAPTSGAMGYGIPGAIAAKIAAPDRPVLAVAGDGGFAMSAMEIETAVREELDLTVVVFRNGLHGTIAMHQARHLGRLVGVTINDIDVAGVARSLGATATTVTGEQELADAYAWARDEPGTSVVDVVVDPDVISPGATLSSLLGSHVT
jgi:acetolactate synthase-1/2/3 large subunit